MNSPVETRQYKGVEIKIMPDQNPMNPREWDNSNTMVCWHRRYKLGDRQPKCDRDEYLRELANPDNPEEITDEQVRQLLEERYLIRPLYLYDHSGLRIKTTPFSCPWDSGQIGFIYTSLDQLIECYGSPYPNPTFDSPTRYSFQDGAVRTLREAGNAVLECEVKVYDQYLSGEVYGWIAGDDSCWGYYGSDFEESGLLEAARDSIDGQIISKRNTHYQRLKLQIKHQVPLRLRTPFAA